MNVRLTLLPAAVVVAGCTTSVSAETWICSHTDLAHPLVAINGELLVEQQIGAVFYNTLQNNELAFVAEDHRATFDAGQRDIVIIISTVMIDKRSNKFTYTTAQSGREVLQLTGHCRGYDEGLENSSAVVMSFQFLDSAVAIPADRRSK